MSDFFENEPESFLLPLKLVFKKVSAPLDLALENARSRLPRKAPDLINAETPQTGDYDGAEEECWKRGRNAKTNDIREHLKSLFLR